MSDDARFDELFLFLEPGADPAKDRVALERTGSRRLLAWAPDAEAAAKIAAEAVNGGVRLIELYRGFDLTSTAQVIQAAVPRAPVAAASYGFGAAPPAGTEIRRSVAIYHDPNADPAKARVVREHPRGWTAVVGAPLDRMPEVATELVEAGAELVELCGGTPLTTAERVRAALGGRIPVSHVAWPFESLDGVHAFKAAYEAETQAS